MTIDTIPIQSIWSLLRRLPRYFLQKYFTQARLAQLIHVDIRPRHDSTVVNLGETASFALYLQAINLSPFPVELDRASFKLWLGGAHLDASILKKQMIAPGEIATLHVSGLIPDGLANQTARTPGDFRVALEGNIEFNCSVHSFAKTVDHLDGINAKFHNTNFRTTS